MGFDVVGFFVFGGVYAGLFNFWKVEVFGLNLRLGLRLNMYKTMEVGLINTDFYKNNQIRQILNWKTSLLCNLSGDQVQSYNLTMNKVLL